MKNILSLGHQIRNFGWRLVGAITIGVHVIEVRDSRSYWHLIATGNSGICQAVDYIAVKLLNTQQEES